MVVGRREALDPQEMLAQIDAFPYGPGESPFRIKGNGYKGKLEYIDSLAGGRKQVFEVLARPEVEAFYAQPFLSSVWYDVVPILATTAAVAVIHGESFEERVASRSRHQARKDIGGVHRMLMRLAPAKVVALRVSTAVAQYFDFVTLEAKPSGPTALEFDMRQIPQPVDIWLEVVVRTYFEEVLRIGAARNPRVTSERAPAGEVSGVPSSKIHYDVSWR